VVGAAKSLGGIGAAAGLGAGATAAAIVGAFALGYAIGTGLRYVWQRLQPEERAYRAALEFGKAHRQFAAAHGRQPTHAEISEMRKGFDTALARLK
jgi:hypothetical protein